MSLSNPRKKMDQQNPDQLESAKKFRAVEELARKAGFDDDALAYTEFCLMPFFELVVEECAKVAEEQSRNYTGEYKEGDGCHGSAIAIRAYAKRIGNRND